MSEITTYASALRILAEGGYVINLQGMGIYYIKPPTDSLTRLSDVIFLRLVRREEISRDPEAYDIWRINKKGLKHDQQSAPPVNVEDDR